MVICPCGTNVAYDECCLPLIKGEKPALTAEELMRARYCAYAMKEIGYLHDSLHPDHRTDFDEKTTLEWADRSEWHKLEIVNTIEGGAEDKEGKVEFIAIYTDNGVKKEHHELSTFKKKDELWYLVNGEIQSHKPVVRTAPKIGRNDPCTCGSGKKFKKCCG